ncbi:MAG: hypothetical protein Q8P77_03170, partial [Candidatus Veblenbacteria bacterium]|nr:hypothetical protein [Candidatus Veblenbacteria bacterium]
MKTVRREVILDFDYTVFDAGRFKQALARSLKRLGVSPEVFFNMYPRAVHRGGGQYSYEPLSHLRLLKGEYPKLGLT